MKLVNDKIRNHQDLVFGKGNVLGHLNKRLLKQDYNNKITTRHLLVQRIDSYYWDHMKILLNCYLLNL